MNLIQKLRLDAAEAWRKHFDMCSEKGVWKILDPSLHDIAIVEMSWKLRWIEDRLEEYETQDN